MKITIEEIINTLRDREITLFDEYKTLRDNQGVESNITNQVKDKWTEVWDLLMGLKLKTHNHIKLDQYIEMLQTS